LPPSAPTDLVAQPGTEAGITFTFTPGDPGDSAITRYEYSLNGDAGSGATWTSLGNLLSPYQFVVSSGLTNGREYTLFLRAVSNSGVGESATVAFRPRADFTPITLTVDSTDARGFYLSGGTSDYVKQRDQAGIPDKNGGTTKSLDASLFNVGDVWRADIKSENLNAGGRVLQRLHDLESLSYEVWHDQLGNYPSLKIFIDGGEKLDETLTLQVNQQPLSVVNRWNTVTVNLGTSQFKNDANNQKNNGGEDVNAGATYTLNQWIKLFGDQKIKKISWGGKRQVPSTTYLDFLEINGATYDFEAVPPAVIAPPPTIQSVAAGDGQVTVSFSAGDNAGATVLAYEYQVDEGEWTSTPDGDTVAPFTISGLTNGTPYTLTMRTVSGGLGDATLESEASDPVSFIPVGLPLPPTNLSATVGDGSAEINFTNSGTGNGAPIMNYHVKVDSDDFIPLSTPDDSGPITIAGLTNDQVHTVALKTQTSVGLSVASASLSFTPVSGASAPAAPTNVVLTPGDKRLSVTFTPGGDNGAAITNYAYQINGGRWFNLSPASTASSLVITGLSNGETYSVSLRGINAKGMGANSAPVTATLPRPKLIILTGDGKTIDLNITPESGSSCSIATAALTPAPALEANVKLAYANMFNFSLENCNAGETVAVAITLSEDPPADGIAHKYQGGQWRVIAGATIIGKTISYNLTDNGPLDADPTSGKISDPVAVAVPTGLPGRPEGLSVTAGNGNAVIAFTAGDDGGKPITNYQYSIDGVTFVALDPAAAVSPVTVPGLTNGKAYSLTLKALNENGAGPPSDEVSFTPTATAVPVPLPLWLFALLSVLIGGLGYRRLKMLEAA
jgi:titin